MIDICTKNKHALSKTWRLLYPSHCVLCGNPGFANQDLCPGCHRDLPWNRHACPRCALPLPPAATGVALCAKCQKQRPPYDRAWSAFCYLGALRWLHRRLKFHAVFSHGRLLSQLLANALEESMACEQLLRPDVVVVVPLHPRRLMRRGFNQSLELIRPAARSLQIEQDYHSLRRIRATRPQSGLPSKLRRGNVRSAFDCRRDLTGLSVALFDDVVTTGETVSEAARVLRQAGAQEINVWSLAKVEKSSF